MKATARRFCCALTMVLQDTYEEALGASRLTLAAICLLDVCMLTFANTRKCPFLDARMALPVGVAISCASDGSSYLKAADSKDWRRHFGNGAHFLSTNIKFPLERLSRDCLSAVAFFPPDFQAIGKTSTRAVRHRVGICTTLISNILVPYEENM